MKRIPLFFMTLFTSSTVFAQQFLPVKGIVNARELGGYEVPGGLRVRNGMLLRAAHLAEATDADMQYLAGIPVSVVIDFRREQEKLGVVDRLVRGARYVVLPIDTSGDAEKGISEKEKKKIYRGKKFNVKKIILLLAFNKKAQAVARDMYPTLLFHPECQRQFARFFREVVATESGAVLYHCTQGKDRTGIASALLLAALGADRGTIVADFDVTNQVYADDVRKYSRRVKFFGGKDEQVGVVKAFLGANTENFVKALDRIDAEYGSLENYLRGPMGLSDEDFRILRERYLVPAK
jgi:protein-tyrosine phosphatase